MTMLFGSIKVQINKQNIKKCQKEDLLIKLRQDFNNLIGESEFVINDLEKFEFLENKLHLLLKELYLLMDGWNLKDIQKEEFSFEINAIKSKLHKKRCNFE
uniref:Uncharacterized protein n=1 Tax=Meloidogyne hapla TaxID=6305 RepID=A0A1I8BP02_MELHA